MDPITVALVASGAIVFGAMIFFLIDNVEKLRRELEESQERALEAKRKAEELKKRIEVQERVEAERRKDMDKVRRLNSIKNDLEALYGKLGKENSIARSIDSIISGGPATIVLNIVRLIDLIRKSFFLSNNLKNPENSISDIQREIEFLERKLERVADE